MTNVYVNASLMASGVSFFQELELGNNDCVRVVVDVSRPGQDFVYRIPYAGLYAFVSTGHIYYGGPTYNPDTAWVDWLTIRTNLRGQWTTLPRDDKQFAERASDWKHKTEEEFLGDVRSEVKRARKKFPESKNNFAALVEEVGELAKEFLEKGSRQRRYEEAVQVACVALRCALEGDPAILSEET